MRVEVNRDRAGGPSDRRIGRRRLRRVVQVLVVSMAASAAMGVDARQDTSPSWLPARAIEGLTGQLAQRLETINGAPAEDRAALIAAARTRVLTMIGVINAWPPRGIITHAPDLTRLDLPPVANPHLDAVARYHICNVILMQQYERGATPAARQRGAMGLTALTAVQGRLLAPYLADGGTTTAVEALLTGAPMAKAIERIQRDPATRDYAQEACAPVVVDLVGMMR